MAEGRSNAAIAAALVVTEKAVGKHIEHLHQAGPAGRGRRQPLAVLRYLQDSGS